MEIFNRILVPLDGSQLAEQILPYVTRISKGLGVPVHLIQVFPSVSGEIADPAHGLYQTRISQGVRDEAIDYLRSVAWTVGADVTYDAIEGDAVSSIVEEAERSPGCMIAMSTHGRSGLTRFLIGSVTDKVLHATKTPMLIVRGHRKGDPQPNLNLDTIIVPVDGSELAEQVIPHVLVLAKGLELKITLLRVVATAEEFSAQTGYQQLEGVVGLNFPSFETMARETEKQALTYLQNLEESLREQGVASIDHRIVRGSPAHAIVDLAQETSDNLVAMTTHGRSGPARWTMGSVTDRVVQHSGDSVLVVRTG